MSVYKVPQDVEAEDKIVGPFTLKQFIFLIVAFVSGYITFALASINILLSVLTLPIVIVFGILGIYRRSDQPVEVYLASLIRFYLKPRRRLWDQDGIMEPVHITAPPKVEHRYTDGRTAGQVSSQLRELANMMDTRGWSSKNASLQAPSQFAANRFGGDRLVAARELPQTVQPTEIHPSDDIMDVANNPVAQTMDSLVQGSAFTARDNAVQGMQPITPQATPQPEPIQYTLPTRKNRQSQKDHSQKDQDTSVVTAEATPDIMRLSQNSDLNVSTLARQVKQGGQDLDDEGEIPLR